MSHRLPTGLDSGGGTFSLRYQFAKDGDSDSQVAVAKILLSEESDSNERRFENANLAIHWLLRAATSGHSDAFSLLQQCYKSGLGITPVNLPSVQACIALSKEDIVAFRIGHQVFRSTMSDNEDSIIEENFAEKVELLFRQNDKGCDVNDGDNKLPFEQPSQSSSELKDECPVDDQKRISVSDIVYSVKQCLEGNLPLVALKNVVQQEEYNKWFSWKYVHVLWNVICRSLEGLIKDLGSPILPCMLLICFLLCCVCNYSPEGEVDFVTSRYEILFSSIFSLVIMLSCTCYIIILHFGYYNVNKWLDLIKLFEPAVRSDEVREKYIWKTLYPLLAFFFASVMFNILQPIQSVKFFSGELVLLSILLLILVDRTVTNGRYHVNISFILNGVLCLHKMHVFKGLHFWEFLNFDIHFAAFKHFEIHMNWLSCITLPFVLPYLYFSMAKGHQKKGWLQTLLPHLMCLTWMNFACDFAKSCTFIDILVGALFWIVVFLLSHIIGALKSLVMCSIAKVFYLTETLTYGVMLHSVLPAVIVNFYFSRWLVEKSKQLLNKTVALICFSFLTIMLLKTVFPINLSMESSDVILSWSQYETYCHKNAWYRTNVADVEIECLPLKGKTIFLEGTITQIDMIQSKNAMSYVAYLLPSFFSQWFTCVFGKQLCSGSEDSMSSFQKERCALFKKMELSECHLHNWDVYQYRIVLEVTSRTSPEVVVIADHACSSFIKKLKDGDSLQVIGVLSDGVGSISPEIHMKEATCNTCYDQLRNCKRSLSSSSFDYRLSWHQVITFYLSPFIQYLM